MTHIISNNFTYLLRWGFKMNCAKRQPRCCFVIVENNKNSDFCQNCLHFPNSSKLTPDVLLALKNWPFKGSFRLWPCTFDFGLWKGVFGLWPLNYGPEFLLPLKKLAFGNFLLSLLEVLAFGIPAFGYVAIGVYIPIPVQCAILLVSDVYT